MFYEISFRAFSGHSKYDIAEIKTPHSSEISSIDICVNKRDGTKEKSKITLEPGEPVKVKKED